MPTETQEERYAMIPKNVLTTMSYYRDIKKERHATTPTPKERHTVTLKERHTATAKERHTAT